MTKKKSTEADKLKQLFSERVNALMAERGWNAEAVAKASPVIGYHAVMRWKSGERFPRPHAIVDLAKAFGITPGALLEGIPVPLKTIVQVDAIVGTPR